MEKEGHSGFFNSQDLKGKFKKRYVLAPYSRGCDF